MLKDCEGNGLSALYSCGVGVYLQEVWWRRLNGVGLALDGACVEVDLSLGRRFEDVRCSILVRLSPQEVRMQVRHFVGGMALVAGLLTGCGGVE